MAPHSGKMHELALFAGVGGGLLATKWLLGFRTVCYVEIGKWPVEILKARIRDGLLDDAPIWDDVRTFDGKPWRGLVDIVTGGFPCQPFSVAGKRKGAMDERNLWPNTVRVIGEVRPEWVLLENVRGLLSSGYFGQILHGLARCGYDARWKVLSAAEVGAPHRRDRLWIVAHANETGLERPSRERMQRSQVKPANGCADVADSSDKYVTRSVGKGDKGRQPEKEAGDGSPDAGALADAEEVHVEGRQDVRGIGHSRGWWEIEPRLDRVAHGVANRVDRLKAIGEGQVPAVAALVWEMLTGEWWDK